MSQNLIGLAAGLLAFLAFVVVAIVPTTPAAGTGLARIGGLLARARTAALVLAGLAAIAAAIWFLKDASLVSPRPAAVAAFASANYIAIGVVGIVVYALLGIPAGIRAFGAKAVDRLRTVTAGVTIVLLVMFVLHDWAPGLLGGNDSRTSALPEAAPRGIPLASERSLREWPVLILHPHARSDVLPIFGAMRPVLSGTGFQLVCAYSNAREVRVPGALCPATNSGAELVQEFMENQTDSVLYVRYAYQ